MQRHTSVNSDDYDLIKNDDSQKNKLRLEIPEDYKVEVCRYDPYGTPCSDCRKFDFQQYLECRRAVDLLERIDIANSLKNE